MPTYRALITLGTLAVTVGIGAGARASEPVALSFDLPTRDRVAEPQPAPEPPQAVVPIPNAPLPVPGSAAHPPLASAMSNPPAGVYGGGPAIALSPETPAQQFLPKPPPVDEATVTAIAPALELPSAQPHTEVSTAVREAEALGLTFEVAPSVVAQHPAPEAAPAKLIATPFQSAAVQGIQGIDASHLFQGGADSVVARAVGSAEGTRTPEGHRTPAYFGHTDPGNRVWNLGSFSYQHGANSPEEADAKQLARLRSQTEQLQKNAAAKGITLTLEELLNGIDLANQAPLAALDRGGYIDWLAQAHGHHMEGLDAIVWARTRSFLDPDTQRWNAPGLGNTVHGISRDQERRAQAIARALDAAQQTGLLAPEVPVAEAPTPPDQAIAISPTAAAQPLAPIGVDLSLAPAHPEQIPSPGAIAAQAQLLPLSSPARDRASSTAASLDTAAGLDTEATPSRELAPETEADLAPPESPAKTEVKPSSVQTSPLPPVSTLAAPDPLDASPLALPTEADAMPSTVVDSPASTGGEPISQVWAPTRATTPPKSTRADGQKTPPPPATLEFPNE
ncbi:MAG: hypothetical protein IGR92_03260 [Leptolyngbyaceae cyanobacterium T60_A2020_046]|nr:hypothetical protein [Leptolyngbyaceae cyanobacterium T60_A2020_046]